MPLCKYNQYESMILPLIEYLKKHDVDVQFGMDVKNVVIEEADGKKTAKELIYVKDNKEQSIPLTADDLVFITNGCCTDTSSYGDQTHAPDLSHIVNGKRNRLNMTNMDILMYSAVIQKRLTG